LEPSPVDGDAECDSNHSLPSEVLGSPALLSPTTALRPSQPCPQPQDNTPSASSLSQQHHATTGTPTTTSTKGTLGQATPEQQSLAGPEDKEEEPTLDLGPVTEDTEEEPVTGETEEEAAAQEEKLGDVNAKGGSKRRSGRTTQRR
jgi:hypothetical protein